MSENILEICTNCGITHTIPKGVLPRGSCRSCHGRLEFKEEQEKIINPWWKFWE